MDYTNINNLSMTGGDDFTDINGLLSRCVLLDTNQNNIIGEKTFKPTTDNFYITNSSGANKIGITGTTTAIDNTNINITGIVGILGDVDITGQLVVIASGANDNSMSVDTGQNKLYSYSGTNSITTAYGDNSIYAYSGSNTINNDM